ncbi:hypothetical protein UPYG_G00141170 [Umbra pygmaea]|uniref:C2H2-type domain-containing protein n=1 Tax=Umbra pygmaea TaxID=75934 RepID=A0ABD0XG34_UMBPY
MQNHPQKDEDTHLPLSSLRLYVPPLQLVSAALWQVVRHRVIMDYGLVEEFVSTVLEVVPKLMSYRERVQLIMGLRAQLVLELFRTDQLADTETIQPHLNRVRSCVITHRENEVPDPEVETSESNFLKLVQILLEDPVEKENFFQNVFLEEFGSTFDSALQSLMWEFLTRLEKLLPAPTLEQTASCISLDHYMLEDCVQSVCQPDPLKTLLQYHINTYDYVDTNALSSVDNHILSSLSLSPSPLETSKLFDSEVKPETLQGFLNVQSPASSDKSDLNTPLNQPQTDSGQENLEGSLNKVQDSSSFSTFHLQSRVLLHRMDITGIPLPVNFPTLKEKMTQYSSTPDMSQTTEPSNRSKRVKRCSLCAKTFIEAEDLTAHIMSHTEPSPYQCTKCFEGFEDQDGFQKHQQTGCEDAAELEEDNLLTASYEDEIEKFQPPCISAPSPTALKVWPTRPRSSKKWKCLLCHKKYTTVYAMRQHQIFKHDQLLYQCCKCEEHFKSKCILREHMAESHPSSSSKPRTCYLCNSTFTSLYLMKKHLKSQHDMLLHQYRKTNRKTEFSCVGCSKKFDERCHLSEHIKMCLAAKDLLSCFLCKKTFVEPNRLKAHMKYHERMNLKEPKHVVNRLHTCCMCDQSFIFVRELKAHWRSHMFQCTQCMQKFTLQEDLQKHLQQVQEVAAQVGEPDKDVDEGMEISLSQESNAYLVQRYSSRARTCRLCHNTFNHPSAMRTHLKSKHAQLPYQCIYCKENFKKKLYLNEHRKECNPGLFPKQPIKMRTCHLCQKTFHSFFGIRKHLKTQHGLLPYQCTDCGKDFLKKRYLSAHKKDCSPRPHQDLRDSSGAGEPNEHTGEIEPANGGSSMASSGIETEHPQSPNTLNQNVTTSVTPPTQKTFLCEVCGKGFQMLSRMKEHIRAHTGERPFHCRDCGKGFSRKRSLKRHRLIHREGRPFLCTDCGKCFTEEKSLKSHQLLHTGERPFVCTLCNASYLTKKHLQRHMKKHFFEKHS